MTGLLTETFVKPKSLPFDSLPDLSANPGGVGQETQLLL